jgi:hypothetical protein
MRSWSDNHSIGVTSHANRKKYTNTKIKKTERERGKEINEEIK